MNADKSKAQEVLDRYNRKWHGHNNETANLYRKATRGKTPQYGCKLQDHVLALMGYPGLKTIKRLSPAALRWVDWMLK